MAIEAVMGIDMGTSVVKAGVYALTGRLLAVESAPVSMTHGTDGSITQDLDDLYDAAAAASRAVLEVCTQELKIVSIAFSGQMAGIGIVGSDHCPVAPYDSWLDTRCGDIVGELGLTLGDRILRTAGCAPTISIGPKMLWWHRHHSDVLERAASFVTAAGYVAGRVAGLSGRDAFIDPSYLHFASFADVGKGVWDDELVGLVGILPELLPRVVESTEVIGKVTSAAGLDFGLAPGVPIAAGCGDTAACALGAGVTAPGQAFDAAGTAGVFGVCLPQFVPDAKSGTLMTMRAALPGLWYSLAYVAGAGQLIEWACRQFLGRAQLDAGTYQEFAEAAARVPAGSDGVLLFPHFMGRVAPAAPSVRGAILGLSPTTTRDHMVRATLESIAFEYLGYAQLVRAAAGPEAITEVLGTGGGSRMAVWNQIKADVLQTAYRPVVGIDPGTRGSAVLAMTAIGVSCPDLEASNMAAPASPDANVGAAYAEMYDSYRQWADLLVSGYGRRPRIKND